jgi:hypothetical protein
LSCRYTMGRPKPRLVRVAQAADGLGGATLGGELLEAADAVVQGDEV